MKNLRPLIFPALSLICLIQSAIGNTDVRQWISDGEVFSAELIRFDPETGLVVFKDKDGSNFEMKSGSLGLTDQAWLKEWSFMTERFAEKLEKEGGELEHLQTSGKYPTDLFVYHPPGVENPAERPMLILFHPGGKAQRYLMRFIEAAAELKVVVVGCGTFRNTGRHQEDLAKEEELLARFREMLPQLEQEIAHDPKKMMMGGSSGGAWRAYHYSAWVERPWLGIFSNGGWLGTKAYWDLPYPAMRVAIVNGNLDPSNRVVESDSKILMKRDCEVAVFSFEGGHQAAPIEHTIDALQWIIEAQVDE